MRYKKEFTEKIVFPVGGIGSGCIGISGNGTLRDFEIFNRPNKCSYNKYSGIVVKAENNEKVIDVRSLNGIYQHSLEGDWGNIGQGIERSSMAGLPWFEEHEFVGEFPFCTVKLKDKHFPGNVSMEVYNPFIPSNDKDSSLPCAIFEIKFTNNTEERLKYTAAFNITNPCIRNVKNEVISEKYCKGIIMNNIAYKENEPEYGHIFIATDIHDCAYQQYWRRNSWYEGLEMFWNDFSNFGKMKNRYYEGVQQGETTGTLNATVEVNPGEENSIRFVLSWYYPNCYNYWKPEKNKRTIWKNFYAVMFKNAVEVAEYVFENSERLHTETLKFKNALYSSSLPDSVKDAVCSNISILKTPVCLRLEDGTLYGFEGCSNNEGSCEGSCSHVWNYQYALPFLFPKLERSMREIDFKYNEDENGGMKFRMQLPLGREQWDFRSAVDAQFGGILKTYREWKICGDDEWLKKYWNTLKRNMEYTWSKKNPDKWDIEKTGVLWGRQHHTLDRELFGPNSWLTGFYLAALKAMTEMAKHLGEPYEEYDEIFKKGKKWVEANLFNGEYFIQKIDLKDFSELDKYENCDRYYNDETGEINFQVGEGSIIDQVVAQWHANILGLGEIFDNKMVKSALESLYTYNFKQNMKEIFNPCRIFAYNDEPGMLMCEWNTNVYKPVMPIPYSREVMTGFEYQAAVHMISEGMEEQGISIIKAVRDRYDGKKRNPWNEFECGSNYVRAMSSYSALLIYSGFKFNMQRKEIGFKPIVNGDCQFFWSIDSAWGTYKKRKSEIEIEIIYGSLNIERIVIDVIPEQISIDGKNILFTVIGDTVLLDGYIKCSKVIVIQ